MCRRSHVTLSRHNTVERWTFGQYCLGFNFNMETCAFKVLGETGAADATLRHCHSPLCMPHAVSSVPHSSEKPPRHSYSHALPQTPKPAPLVVFAAEFSSAENPPKKIWLAVFDDVLDFWSKNAQVGIYPTLCQLANIHLSASAASVPVESMFSTAGLVANSKRSSISAERLHRV